MSPPESDRDRIAPSRASSTPLVRVQLGLHASELLCEGAVAVEAEVHAAQGQLPVDAAREEAFRLGHVGLDRAASGVVGDDFGRKTARDYRLKGDRETLVLLADE